MKKYSLLLGLLLVFSLILAACGPAPEETLVALGETLVGDLTETPLPGTGGTQALTTPTTAAGVTSGAEETTAATEAETEAATRAATTGAATTQRATGTAIVPGTGATAGATGAATSGAGATAGATQRATVTSGGPGTGMVITYGRLTSLLDATVQDQAGNEVATVSDMIANMCSAQITWAALTPTGDDFGTRTNDVLVPMDILMWNNDGFFVLAVNPSQITSAPDIDINTIDFSSPDWNADLLAYWSSYMTNQGAMQEPNCAGFMAPGTSASATPSGGAMATETPGGTAGASNNGYVLASNLIGMNVEDMNGDNVGEVNDLIVNTGTGSQGGAGSTTGTAPAGSAGTGTPEPGTAGGGSATGTPSGGTGGSTGVPGTGQLNMMAGSVHYVVIGAGGFLGIGEKNIPVPVSVLGYNPDTNSLVIDKAGSELADAPTVDLDDLSATGWDTEANTYWGVTP